MVTFNPKAWDGSFNYTPGTSTGAQSSGLNWGDAGKEFLKGFAGNLSSSMQRGKYTDKAASAAFGSGTDPGGFNIGSDIGVYTPGQMPATVIPGDPGEPGFGEKLLGGAASALPGAAVSLFSDIQLKENVEKVGTSPTGVNVYQWNYKGGKTKYQGVIAQEVPWAAIKDPSGYLKVDYSKVDVEFKQMT